MSLKRDVRIDTDPDFVDSPKHENSLKILLEDYPDGAPDHIIRRVLRVSQEELDSIFGRAILKLKERLGDE